MDDARDMGLGDCLARLKNELYGRNDRKGPAFLEDVSQIAPDQEIHDHVGRARVELADVDHSGDMLALQPHRRARLAKKALDGVRIAEHVLAHELDGHELPELLVSRREHHPHPARAQNALDAILSGE